MQIEQETERSEQHGQREAYLFFNNDGVIMDVSASATAILGFPPQLLIGKPMAELCVYRSALSYLHDLMLLHGYAGNFRICLKDAQHHTHLFECCAANLMSPSGTKLGTELLLHTLSSSHAAEECAKIKVSQHGGVLQANASASSMLSTWNCQLGALLPDDLAVEAHQAWATGKVITTQKKAKGIVIFVPQTYLSLIIIHMLTEARSQEATHSMKIPKEVREAAHTWV